MWFLPWTPTPNNATSASVTASNRSSHGLAVPMASECKLGSPSYRKQEGGDEVKGECSDCEFVIAGFRGPLHTLCSRGEERGEEATRRWTLVKIERQLDQCHSGWGGVHAACSHLAAYPFRHMNLCRQHVQENDGFYNFERNRASIGCCRCSWISLAGSHKI
jgi:hypothetical protein